MFTIVKERCSVKPVSEKLKTSYPCKLAPCFVYAGKSKFQTFVREFETDLQLKLLYCLVARESQSTSGHQDFSFYIKVISEDEELLCVFCRSHMEMALHLFLQCSFSTTLWSFILQWLGADLQPPESLNHFFVSFLDVVNWGAWLLVWHAAVWYIWELRKGIVFGNDKVDMIYLLDRVKVCYWRWFTAKYHGAICSFSDWCIDPLSCLCNLGQQC